MKEENYKAPIYQGEVIRMINDKKNNIMEQRYDSIEDADFFEIHLDFMDVHYQRPVRGWHRPSFVSSIFWWNF